MLQSAAIRFGHGGDYGRLVAGSQWLDFPTEDERLLFSVGANQAAVIIQRKPSRAVIAKGARVAASYPGEHR